MKHFNWPNFRIILLLAVIVFLYSFSSYRNENRNLIASEIIFVEENAAFIQQETVNNMLIENNSDVKSIKKTELNLNKLEKSINNNPMIEKSEVFVSIDGVLKAKVKQKTPIARVFNNDNSFYIDYQGSKMPLSNNYTARVPIISGEIKAEIKDEFYKLLKFVNDDDFLKKNIIGIQIYPNGSIQMQNRSYDYVIEFGKPTNIETKFNNYKAFFQKTSVDNTIQKYKSINLIFSQQVVGTK
jgi:cell division protein FtsQ